MKFAFCLLLLAVVHVAKGESADPEELAIYRVLFSGTDAVVMEKSEAPAKGASVDKPDVQYQIEFSAFLKRQFPSAEDATIKAYVQHPPGAALLTPKSDVGAKLVFIDGKTMGEIFKGGKDLNGINAEWADFKRRYPAGGFTFVSRVSFNPEKTQALVFIETSFGSTGMDGYTVFLRKQNGKWIEVGREEDVAS